MLPRLAYSCVIDGDWRFEWQGLLWICSLIRNAGCDPADLKVHCLPSVSSEFRAAAARLGVCIVDAEPFPADHGYCNKIQQCDSSAFAGYEWLVLSDADLFFLKAPRLRLDAPLSGKPVDWCNPPLTILRRVYARRGIRPSPEIAVTAALAPADASFRSNLNGGLYVIAAPLLRPLGAVWRRHASWLIEHIDLLERYWKHVDQVAMALAIDELEIPVSLLTARENFPMHLSARKLRAIEAPAIDVLHYHSSFSRPHGLKLRGVAAVDEYVSRANRDIAEIVAWPALRQYLAWPSEPARAATSNPSSETDTDSTPPSHSPGQPQSPVNRRLRTVLRPETS